MIFFFSSVIVSFAGGIIALFAPCCISYLLPAYLGAIVKERSRRVLGTTLYTLGIATFMVPTTLGFWAFLRFYQDNHTLVYVIGGVVMIALGVYSVSGLEWKLPMVRLPLLGDSSTIWMFYPLGLLSGLTTICCAPVLAGAIALGAISPTFLQSMVVALAYTAGIVFPLFLATFVLQADALTGVRKWLMRPFTMSFGGRMIKRSRGDCIAALLFTGIGIATILLALTGRIAMPDMTSNFGAMLSRWIIDVVKQL